MPAFGKLIVTLSLGLSLCTLPSSTFTVCVKLSWLVQVTEEPELISIAFGSKR